MSENRPLGVVIPTRWEAADVLHRYPFKRIARKLFEAQINNRTVYLCISGVGPKKASDAANRLVAQGAKELVSMGFCGALVPSLKVGDILHDRIISVEKPARTPQERRALTERANALAVDMETQAVIEAGTRLGVPIRIHRVVSDEFQDDLTPLFGNSGDFSVWRMAFALLHPQAWPLARKLKKQSQIARARLADGLS